MGAPGAGHPCHARARVRGLPARLPTAAVLVPLCPRSFRNFDVEESHQCSLDWLMLGPAAPPRQEAFRLCGSAIPPAFISARDHVWIFFHSDASSSGQAQGFRLSYIRGEAGSGVGSAAGPRAAPSPGLPQQPRGAGGLGWVRWPPHGALKPLQLTDPTSQTWLEWAARPSPLAQVRDNPTPAFEGWLPLGRP